jgi:opacity protein-like surface antigen
MQKMLLVVLFITALISAAIAQVQTPAQQLVLTNEDSLHAGIGKSKTVVSGYGSAFYQRNSNAQTATMNLERAVLFVGHQFNSKISFFSELEIENAKVGHEADGEIAMEQAFLKFNLNSTQYITAGLFTPRIGILNENHLPINFNGVERPIVEQLIIPATWRELGIAFYGRSKKMPLTYTVALLNGLNGPGLQHGSGLMDGRFEGSEATANNLALTAAIQYFYNDFTFQVSGYAGGSNGFGKRKSDSLQLSHGIFAMPLYLGEADVKWTKDGWNAKAIGAYVSYPDAGDINKAFANNISNSMYGAYAELAYNLFEKNTKLSGQQLNAFARYEILDMNASIPSNAIYDGTEKQQHIIAGLSYLPIPNVVIKADVRFLHTGKENPALVINPSPVRLPYRQNNNFINMDIGYSF